MPDPEKIKEEGIKILEEFSEKLEGLPDTEETHYVADIKNVWRPDKKPEKKKFRQKIEKIAPKMEDGYVVAEKGV